MVAEARDVHACFLACLEYRGARVDFDRLAIHGNCKSVGQLAAAALLSVKIIYLEWWHGSRQGCTRQRLCAVFLLMALLVLVGSSAMLQQSEPDVCSKIAIVRFCLVNWIVSAHLCTINHGVEAGGSIFEVQTAVCLDENGIATGDDDVLMKQLDDAFVPTFTIDDDDLDDIMEL